MHNVLWVILVAYLTNNLKNKMEYNKESFKKALKECGIIRWENHFEKVVKAYLKAEAEQLTLPDVTHR